MTEIAVRGQLVAMPGERLQRSVAAAQVRLLRSERGTAIEDTALRELEILLALLMRWAESGSRARPEWAEVEERLGQLEQDPTQIDRLDQLLGRLREEA